MIFHLQVWINISLHPLFIMSVIVNVLINFHLFYIILYLPLWNKMVKALEV